MFRVEPIDHTSASMARQIHVVQMAAYTQEAKLLGAVHFPPLDRTVEQVQASQERFVAAFAEDQLAGAISVGPDPEGLGLNIGSLVVAPEWQRQGVGRSLLGAVLALHGSGDLTVQTGAKNGPALALYERSGFVELRRWLVGPELLELVKLHRPGR